MHCHCLRMRTLVARLYAQNSPVLSGVSSLQRVHAVGKDAHPIPSHRTADLIIQKKVLPNTFPSTFNNFQYLSRRIPIPLPDPLIHNIPILPLRVPPVEHHTLPPACKPVMQIEAQIPAALVQRRVGTLRRRFTGKYFRADGDRDGRVGVSGVGVGQRAAAGAGVEVVIDRVICL